MPDLPDHVLERLRDTGVSEADIARLRSTGAITHEGTNGEQVSITLDPRGALVMSQVTKRTGNGAAPTPLPMINQLPAEQAAAVRAGLHQAESMLGADLDGDGSVGTTGQPPRGRDSHQLMSALDIAEQQAHVTSSHAHGRSPRSSPHSMESGNGGATRTVVLALVLTAIAYGIYRTFA